MRIRQIALVARELEPSVAALTELLDVPVCHRDPGVAQFGLENALMAIGDTFLEVVSPVKSDTTAGRFLERRGDSGYMVIFETLRLDEDRARVEGLGARVVWEIALDDIRTVHLHPKDTGGAIVSIDEPKPAGEWRWAGPDWKRHVQTSRVRRIVSAEIEARDPTAMAARWAALLGLPGPLRDGTESSVAVDDGELRFVPAGARGEGISAFGVECIAPVHDRSVDVCGVRIDLRSSGTG